MRNPPRLKKLAQWFKNRRSNTHPDGIDGPSKSTDAAVSSAIELIIGHFKL